MFNRSLTKKDILISTGSGVLVGVTTGAVLGAIAGSLGVALHNAGHSDYHYSTRRAALQGTLGGIAVFGGIGLLAGVEFFERFVFQPWNSPEKICADLAAILIALQATGQMGLNLYQKVSNDNPDMDISTTANTFLIGSAFEVLFLMFATVALQLIMSEYFPQHLNEARNDTERPNRRHFIQDKAEGLLGGAVYGIAAGALAGSIGAGLYNLRKESDHSPSLATMQGVVGGLVVYSGIGLATGGTLFKKLVNSPYETWLRAFVALAVIMGGLQFAGQIGLNMLNGGGDHHPDLTIDSSAKVFAIGGALTLAISFAMSRALEPCIKNIPWLKHEENSSSLRSPMLSETDNVNNA